MISPSTIERVKDIAIYDVVSKFVDLKKTGSTWRGLSPFTDEKTASCYVIPSKNIFKDFSSGKGGNGITFMMEKKGFGFVDAVKALCDMNGIHIEWEISEKPNEDQSALEELYGINRAAAHRYNEVLYDTDATHPAFCELINKRRFSPDTIVQWQIGFAPTTAPDGGEYKPSAWKFLTSILLERGLIEPGKKLGLIKEKDGIVYDTFRKRIIYPIHDHLGRIAGFGGRAVKPDDFNAKYINSSESPVFDKKRILFGLHFAAQSIRERKYAFLTEGYTDVISFHQANYINTVGTCGTALTDEQCKLLKRYCSKVVIVPDPDAAGQRASISSVRILMKHGFEVFVVRMPMLESGKVDPDELVRMFQPQITEI